MPRYVFTVGSLADDPVSAAAGVDADTLADARDKLRNAVATAQLGGGPRGVIPVFDSPDLTLHVRISPGAIAAFGNWEKDASGLTGPAGPDEPKPPAPAAYTHKALLIDSQYRAKGADPELAGLPRGNRQVPWSWTGVSDALDAMTALGYEHYDSVEVTKAAVCDNYSGHGVLLFFRRPAAAPGVPPL